MDVRAKGILCGTRAAVFNFVNLVMLTDSEGALSSVSSEGCNDLFIRLAGNSSTSKESSRVNTSQGLVSEAQHDTGAEAKGILHIVCTIGQLRPRPPRIEHSDG